MTNRVKVKLVKVRSIHNNLKRDKYTGFILTPPSIGANFSMDTQEDGILITTRVMQVRFYQDSSLEFDTRNSTYRIEPVKEKGEIHITELETDVMSAFVKHKILDDDTVIETLEALVDKLKNGAPRA